MKQIHQFHMALDFPIRTPEVWLCSDQQGSGDWIGNHLYIFLIALSTQEALTETCQTLNIHSTSEVQASTLSC